MTEKPDLEELLEVIISQIEEPKKRAAYCNPLESSENLRGLVTKEKKYELQFTKENILLGVGAYSLFQGCLGFVCEIVSGIDLSTLVLPSFLTASLIGLVVATGIGKDKYV